MHIRWIYVGRFLRYIYVCIYFRSLSCNRFKPSPTPLAIPALPPHRQLKRSVRNDIVCCPSPCPHSTFPTVDVPACSRGSLQWTPMRVTVLPQQQHSWMHSLPTHTALTRRTVKIECLRCRSFSPYYGSSSTRFFFFYYAEKTGWDLLGELPETASSRNEFAQRQ